MLAKERLSHPDYKFYKCNIDDMEAKKVRGMLGVHPKVVNESAGLSIYKDGELIGSLEGEEMRTYGLIEKALNSVQWGVMDAELWGFVRIGSAIKFDLLEK